MTGSKIDTDGSVASDITIALLRLSLHCLVYTPTRPRFPKTLCQCWSNGQQPELPLVWFGDRISIKSFRKFKFVTFEKLAYKTFGGKWKWKIGGNSSRPPKDLDDRREDKGRRER